jgi:hypothetical protein
MNLSNRKVEHPYLDIMTVVFAAVLIVGSILGYTRFQDVEKAKTAFSLKQKTAAEGIAEFDRVMQSREAFLAVSARADATLASISAKIADSASQKAAWDKDAAAIQASYDDQVAAIKAHNDAENAKYKADPRYTTRDYWTFPANPGSPNGLTVDFSGESTALSANETEVSAFLAELKKTESSYKNADVKAIYLNLSKSAEALDSGLKRDLEILSQLVTTGKEGQIVNTAKADLMKVNSEDEWLKTARARALDFIKANNLELIDYDLPGGTDANPSDKSLL